MKPDDPQVKAIDENVTIRKGNTKEYAIYDLVLALKLNPVWLLLFEGDLETWKYLTTVKDGLSMDVQKYMNVEAIYFLVIKFLNMPV